MSSGAKSALVAEGAQGAHARIEALGEVGELGQCRSLGRIVQLVDDALQIGEAARALVDGLLA